MWELELTGLFRIPFFLFIPLLIIPACSTKRPLEREVMIPPCVGTVRERVDWRDERAREAEAPGMFYTIASWQGGKKAACSLTFDDGTLDQYVLAFPELQKRKLKATFFLITRYRKRGYWNDGETKRRLFSWDQARQIREAGHEIGSHTRTHADLKKKKELVRWEMVGSLSRLKREIPSLEGVTFAWPYWRNSEESREIAAEYYLAARAGTGLVKNYGSMFETRKINLFSVDSLGMRGGQQNQPWQLQSERVYREGGWVVLCFHGIDDRRIEREWLGWDPIKIHQFRETLDSVESANFWIAPFGTVTRYIREKNEAVLSLVDAGEDHLVFSLEDGLDDIVYNEPLSIEIEIPRRFSRLRVSQRRETIPHKMKGNGNIVFDALPDGCPIYIESIE